MSKQVIAALIDRELKSLAAQVELYPDDASLCAQPDGVRNPGGNLALHLCGNLQHFIGAQLGQSGYVRNRDAEFARRDVTRAELLAEVARTREVVARALAAVGDAQWTAPYPLQFAGRSLRTDIFMTHLASHLAYHLGQIDTHRRVVSGKAEAAPALGFEDLFAIS